MIALGQSDAELVLAARAGSEHSFARLADRHQGALRAFLRRLAGDQAQADDLAQDTLVAAWGQLDRWRPETSFRAWLCGIGYRKQLTWRRGWARAARRDSEWLAMGAADEASAYAGAGAGGCSPEDRLAVRKAMLDLPLAHRAAVALCLAGDFTHAEAAQALGSPLGTVKSHVARGRERLIQVLGVDDAQP